MSHEERSAKAALAGKTILLTRARAQSEELVALLESEGAKPLIFPVISIHAPSDPKPFESAVSALASYAWVVFTSANGARVTLEEIDRQKISDAFDKTKIAVVGAATSRAIEAQGARVDLVAKEFVGDSLAEDLVRVLAPQSRVLLLRAKSARDVVPDALRAAGHSVDVVTAYETRAAVPADTQNVVEALERGKIDFVTFTSGSTVEHFCALLGDRAAGLLAKTSVVSIGPVTTLAAEKAGIVVAATASPHTADAMVQAMCSSIDGAGSGKRD
ncbi:MAG: uroporphyrinogen-III synthase [Polyangiaceae bacterium]